MKKRKFNTFLIMTRTQVVWMIFEHFEISDADCAVLDLFRLSENQKQERHSGHEGHQPAAPTIASFTMVLE